MTSSDYTFNSENSPVAADQTQRKKGRGCMKWGAIVVVGFFALMGLVNACSPETVEVEGSATTTTMTVTEAADPADAETTTVTTTVTEEVTPEPETLTLTETPVVEQEPSVEGEEEPDQVQGFVAPAPAAPAPAPAPAPRATYANCTDVWNRLGRPITPADPGYTAGPRKLDGNSDGVGCETDPR